MAITSAERLRLFKQEMTLYNGCVLGEDVDRKRPLGMKEIFPYHGAIISPARHGKSSIIQNIVRPCLPQAAEGAQFIYIDCPKDELTQAVAEDYAALNLPPEMLYPFRPGIDGQLPALRVSNGRNIASDALDWLEVTLACMNQADFDAQLQRLRWSFNTAYPVFEDGGGLPHMLMFLKDERYRRRLVNASQNPFIHHEWQEYEGLPATLKHHVLQSTWAWLYALGMQESVLRCFTPMPHALDTDVLVRKGGVLLAGIRQEGTDTHPLINTGANFMRSALLHKVIKSLLRVPRNQRPPALIILDEAEIAFMRDKNVGLLNLILERGAGWGIRLVTIFHNLAQVRKGNEGLFANMLVNARTKIFGGKIDYEDAELLARVAFLRDWNPKAIKDEILVQEQTPRLTYKEIVTRAEGINHEHGGQMGTALALALAHGTATLKGNSTAVAHGKSRGHSHGIGQTLGGGINLLTSTSTSELGEVLSLVDGHSLLETEALSNTEADSEMESESCLLPTGMRESRFSMAYSHPYMNPMTWRP